MVKKIVRSTAAASALVGGMLVFSPTAQASEFVGGMLHAQSSNPASCTITADTPYARNNLVWTGAEFSGCASPVELDLKWSRTGPDGTMDINLNALNNYDYGWDCRWGTPQNRTLYGKAFDSNGVGDESSLKGFTSAHTDCVL